MVMSASHQSLIAQLEKTALLDSRFKDIHCVNIMGDRRRGVLSLVFRATDIVGGDSVAIKVMDPERLGDKYRIDAFEREPEIIEIIEHKKRCLSLSSGLSAFNWNLGPEGLTLPIKFFATEWLENDIDDSFYNQHLISPIEKLKIFRLILLSVEAFHSKDVSHRDLKPDNIRSKEILSEKVIVVIDFGTSAHINSSSLVSDYDQPVGANAYSSPEAFAGLAGFREVGKAADIYSLGCLLYELFNKEMYALERSRNPNFERSLLIMTSAMSGATTWEEKVKLWKTKISLIKKLVEPPPINGSSNSIPPALNNILNDIFSQMVDFDFTTREVCLNKIRNKIDSAIKVLENDKIQRHILDRKRKLRQKKLEKVQWREERLNAYMQKRLSNAES